MKILKYLLLVFFVSSVCHANVEWKDFESIRNTVVLVRANQNRKLIETIRSKPTISYINAFQIAMAHFELKEYKSAAIWFAKSYYRNKKEPLRHYPGVVYKYINSFKSILYPKSPLWQESLYYLALCYNELNEKDYSLRFIKLLSNEETGEIKEKYLELQAAITVENDPKQAKFLYEKLLKIHPKPIYYIKLGTIEEEEKQVARPIEKYFKVFFSIKNQWTYEIAAKQIQALVDKNSSLKNTFSNQQRTYYAEGLRLLAKRAEAASLFKLVNPSRLLGQDLSAYILFYSRLLIDMQDYTALINYSQKNLVALSYAELNEYYVDIGNRLLRRDRYREIYQIIPKNATNKEALLIRLESLRKLKSPLREEEAGEYLQKFDKDSTIAERTYFSACYDKYRAKSPNALSCFESLAELTKEVEVGGRSRYFIAKILQQRGHFEESRAMYQSVYLNSPSDYYTFRALSQIGDDKNNTALSTIQEGMPNYFQELRLWLSKNAHNPDKLKEYFKRKKEDRNFGIDPFWKQWESELNLIAEHATEKTRKAMLFIAAGFPDLGAVYLPKSLDAIQESLIYEQTGQLINDPYLKYRYLQQYLIKKKKSYDVFTLSKLAQESLYPMPYLEIVEEACKSFNVEPARIYSLMKQESSFHPGVRSPVGAAGLMQVMPATARGLNQVLKIPNLDLVNPRHSIQLGTKFYSQMSIYLKGKFEEISVAYNAGPGRLQTWKKTLPIDDIDHFIEEIPFKETHGYVKKTRGYYDKYNILLGYR